MLDLITIKELSQRLNKPESTIRTWKREGKIPKECFFKIGGSVFIKENILNEWIKDN